MKNLTTPLIAAFAGLVLMPASALAGTSTDSQATKMSQNTVVTSSSALTSYTKAPETEVLADMAKMQDGTFVVRDSEGNVFYNHILEVDELSEVDTDVDVIDTYTFEYRGVTYTNKIVDVDATS